MKTALILGITGGFGGYTAQALLHQGWHIRAMLRRGSDLPARFDGIEVVRGDAGKREDVHRAAAGAEIIVYAINPPGYRWEGVAQRLLDITARVAEENGQTIVFPGNVYVFNPDDGPEFNERSPLQPVSSLGRMRQQMEQRLQLASEHGARVIVLRMGDFIAPHARSAWLGHLLKKTRAGFSLAAAGPAHLTHTWACVPDAARAAAELVAIRDDLQAFDVFHFYGYRASFNDIAKAVRQATGKDVTPGAFPWLAIRLLAPFNSMFRGLVEMRYLWQREICLTDEKLRTTLGKPLPQTPLAEAVRDHLT